MFLFGNYNDLPQTVYLKAVEIYLVVVKKACNMKGPVCLCFMFCPVPTAV